MLHLKEILGGAPEDHLSAHERILGKPCSTVFAVIEQCLGQHRSSSAPTSPSGLCLPLCMAGPSGLLLVLESFWSGLDSEGSPCKGM